MSTKKKPCGGCGCTDRKLGRVTLDTAVPGALLVRYKTWVCSPACAARVLVSQGWGFEAGMTSGGVLASDLKVRLWDAINAYAVACGGDTGPATVGDRRMDAVVAVERVLEDRHAPCATLAKVDDCPKHG